MEQDIAGTVIPHSDQSGHVAVQQLGKAPGDGGREISEEGKENLEAAHNGGPDKLALIGVVENELVGNLG